MDPLRMKSITLVKIHFLILVLGIYSDNNSNNNSNNNCNNSDHTSNINGNNSNCNLLLEMSLARLSRVFKYFCQGLRLCLYINFPFRICGVRLYLCK